MGTLPNDARPVAPATPASGATAAVQDDASTLAVGDEIEVDIGPVAHRGVCVARIDGRVVFVRYALPGERAVVRLTEVKKRSFCRGEAVQIVRADARRVTPPCAHFGPGGCGGCDFQHAAGDLQRELKAAVVAEQLHRLAGIDMDVTVEALPGGDFGWRRRVRWAVKHGPSQQVPSSETGAHVAETHTVGGVGAGGVSNSPSVERAGYDVIIGPRTYRSHDVVPISAEKPCLIAASGLTEAARGLEPPSAADEVALVRQDGDSLAALFLRRGRPMAGGSRGVGKERGAGEHDRPTTTSEHVRGNNFRVSAAGFWQAHRHAATVLSGAVADALAGIDLAGGRAWDLYGGAGLFAGVLAETVGAGGAVITVESERAASAEASRNLAAMRHKAATPRLRAVAKRVDRFVRAATERPDVVVLDPPRSGAGPAVVRGIARHQPRVIVYVACDPAALARDAAVLQSEGYRLDLLRAFDAFPQTHHVECVARFVPQ